MSEVFDISNKPLAFLSTMCYNKSRGIKSTRDFKGKVFMIALGGILVFISIVGVIVGCILFGFRKRGIGVCIILASIGIMMCGGSFMPSASSEYENRMFRVFGVLITALFGTLTIYLLVRAHQAKKRMALQRQQEAARAAELQRQKEVKQKKIKAKKLYETCRERNITSIDSEQNKGALRIIAQNMGISDLNIATSMFYEGEKYAAKADKEAADKRLAAIRKQDKDKFDEEYAKTKLVGKDKYLKKARDKRDGYAAMARVSSLMSDCYADNSYGVKADTHDWAALGGLADGIAGPAAGIATALQVQADNQRAVEEANQIMHDSAVKSQEYSAAAYDAQKKSGSASSSISYVESKMVDMANSTEKYKFLTINNFKFVVTQSKNIEVTADCNIKAPVEMFGKPAILDGSLMFAVKSNSGKQIAKGYFCAPGFDDVRLYNVGFDRVKKITVTCIVDDYYALNENENFSCEVSPVQLWTIEK